MKLNEVLIPLLESFKDARRVFSKNWPDELVKETINTFKEVKPKLRGQEKDISYWIKKGFSAFYQATMEAKFRNSKSERKKKIKTDKNYEILASNEKATIYIPFTHKAACRFGSETDWCISKPEQSYFQEYTSEGQVFYMIHVSEEELRRHPQEHIYGSKFTIEVNVEEYRVQLWSEGNTPHAFNEEYFEYLFDGEIGRDDFMNEAEEITQKIKSQAPTLPEDMVINLLRGDLSSLEEFFEELSNILSEQHGDPDTLHRILKGMFGDDANLTAVANSVFLGFYEELNQDKSINFTTLGKTAAVLSPYADSIFVQSVLDKITEEAADIENRNVDLVDVDEIFRVVNDTEEWIDPSEHDTWMENITVMNTEVLHATAQRYINSGKEEDFDFYMETLNDSSEIVSNPIISDQEYDDPDNDLHPFRVLIERAKENPDDEKVMEIFDELVDNGRFAAMRREIARADKHLRDAIKHSKKYGDTSQNQAMDLDRYVVYKGSDGSRAVKNYTHVDMHKDIGVDIPNLSTKISGIYILDSNNELVAVLSLRGSYHIKNGKAHPLNGSVVEEYSQKYEAFAKVIEKMKQEATSKDFLASHSLFHINEVLMGFVRSGIFNNLEPVTKALLDAITIEMDEIVRLERVFNREMEQFAQVMEYYHGHDQFIFEAMKKFAKGLRGIKGDSYTYHRTKPAFMGLLLKAKNGNFITEPQQEELVEMSGIRKDNNSLLD